MSAPEQSCVCAGLADKLDHLTGESSYRLHRRFDRLGRIFGDAAVEKLLSLRVIVFGVGGVGSMAAEALARSAVGRLVLVDFDVVCITNTNRQLQAMQGTVGKPKVSVLGERLSLINPQAVIETKQAFYKEERSDELLTPPWPEVEQYDYVVDCIDNLTAKAHLLASCRALGLPVVSSMGAAGKLDPTQVRIDDLGKTAGCPMATSMRKILRRTHGFPGSGSMGITAVYSAEKRHWPRQLGYDGGLGFRCACSTHSDEHSCDARSLIDGTTMFVTGALGLACASVVVNHFVMPLIALAPRAKANR